MNVLLITSGAPRFSPFSTIEKRMPLGIGFLISVLRNAGCKVFFIDNYLEPGNFLEEDFLIKNHIDYVGVYADTICYRSTYQMLQKMGKLRSAGKWKGKIMVGGPHTSVALDTIPEFVDYIVQGEGEKAILEIINGRAQRVIKSERIKDLDSLPPVAWDYFVNLPYSFSAELIPERPIFTMNTSRGCSFDCAFCSVSSIWGKEYRIFSAERIVSDIEYLVRTYGAKGVYFREDNFTLNKKRVTALCELLVRKNINIKWVCETRVDILDRDLIRLMYEAGCRAFYVGVESGSQRLLDFLKKGITLKQIRQVFLWCREMGVRTYASFVVGVPTETVEERLEAVCLSREIKASINWFNIFVGIPKSWMYDYVLKNNLYEYIDDRGLLYLNGHDELVDQFYGGNPKAKIPRGKEKDGFIKQPVDVSEERKISLYLPCLGRRNWFQRRQLASFFGRYGFALLFQRRPQYARRQFFIAVRYNPCEIKSYTGIILTFLPLEIAVALRFLRRKILGH